MLVDVCQKQKKQPNMANMENLINKISGKPQEAGNSFRVQNLITFLTKIIYAIGIKKQ